jgi:hypothetical protein
VREAVGGELGMPDVDLLEIFDAPQIAILAHSTQVKSSNSQRLGADFRVPGVKAAEEQVRVAVGETTCLNRVGVVDQEQETSRSEA